MNDTCLNNNFKKHADKLVFFIYPLNYMFYSFPQDSESDEDRSTSGSKTRKQREYIIS